MAGLACYPSGLPAPYKLKAETRLVQAYDDFPSETA
jgi:hypothetical protein